jgi:hypothetical protein
LAAPQIRAQLVGAGDAQAQTAFARDLMQQTHLQTLMDFHSGN